MTFADFKKPMLAVAVASAALVGASAQAATVTRTYTLDVAGIESHDVLGAASNVLQFLNVGAGSKVTGIGWDVELLTNGSSWLSEIGVDISGAVFDEGFAVFPGIADDSSGSGSYSSFGILDLADFDIDYFLVGSDGLLRFEFFEYFDDVDQGWDGRWVSGLLTVRVDMTVPEPATYGLAALALLGIGATSRRRKI